jgi:hypothetical protein
VTAAEASSEWTRMLYQLVWQPAVYPPASEAASSSLWLTHARSTATGTPQACTSSPPTPMGTTTRLVTRVWRRHDACRAGNADEQSQQCLKLKALGAISVIFTTISLKSVNFDKEVRISRSSAVPMGSHSGNRMRPKNDDAGYLRAGKE